MHTELLRSERRLAAVSAFALAAMLGAVCLAKPGHTWLLPPCPLHALTGIYCPGCGATRAVFLLAHGHLFHAVGENALAVALLPWILYDLLAIVVRRWEPISTRLRPWAVWGLFAGVLLFAVLRNVPISPFTLLAPTAVP